jgi:hypothetical protein
LDQRSLSLREVALPAHAEVQVAVADVGVVAVVLVEEAVVVAVV